MTETDASQELGMPSEDCTDMHPVLNVEPPIKSSLKDLQYEWQRYPTIKAYFRSLENEEKTELPWFSFDVYALLASCRKRIPGLPGQSIRIFFSPARTLANIDTRPDNCRIIMHSLLNRPDVPKEVIEFILLHELIHLVVPSRKIEEKLTHHPPEFREMERQISRSGALVWTWISLVIRPVAKRYRDNEGIFIKPTWKKKLKYQYPAIDFVREWFVPDFKIEESIMELI